METWVLVPAIVAMIAGAFLIYDHWQLGSRSVGSSGAAGISTGQANSAGALRFRPVHVALLAAVALPMAIGAYWSAQQPKEADAVAALRSASAQGMTAVGETASPSKDQTAGASGGAESPEGADTMLAALQKRVRETPDDPNAWRILAWTFDSTGQYAEAVDAYRKAVALDDAEPRIKSLLGEALVKKDGGTVNEEASKLFEVVLATKPDDERALFYKGLYLQQKGEIRPGLDLWVTLLKNAPEDAPWVAGLRQQVDTVAEQAGIDIAGKLPEWQPAAVFGNGQTQAASGSANSNPHKAAQSKPVEVAQTKGPTASDLENAKSLTSQERNDMARGMVDRLAARLQQMPNDPDGWIMLMRSRLVLEDQAGAQDAFGQAKQALSGDTQALSQVTVAAEQLGLSIE